MERVTHTTNHGIKNAWMALCAMTRKSDGGSAQDCVEVKNSPYDDKITKS